MKVKAIQPHGNPHGSAFWKEAGAVYELPEVEAPGLISAGLVSPVEADDEDRAPAKAKPRRGQPRQD